MRNKGFTLIELLAVIVILAIIAIIATPIVLNIIKNSKVSASKRSVENYLDAVENAIEKEELTNTNFNPTNCEIGKEGTQSIITCNGKKLNVEVNGAIPESGKIKIINGVIDGINNLYLSNYYINKVNGEFVVTSSAKPMCSLKSGNPNGYGAKYECDLDDTRTFFLLESSADNVVLIMDRNFNDSVVPKTMAWCDPSGLNPNNSVCNHDMLNPYIEYIQSKFGSDVTVGLPTKTQLSNSNNTNAFLYDYLSDSYWYGSGTKPLNSNSNGAMGYWTSTSASNTNVYYLFSGGYIDTFEVNIGVTYGIRPVITLPKSKLG